MRGWKTRWRTSKASGSQNRIIEHLRPGGKFDESFLDQLTGVSFTGNVRAMREGSVFFAGEPVMEVRAPLPEAQLVETRLINIVNMQTIFATKASRVVEAAKGKPVVDFAARRTHGMEASYAFARSAYIAGFEGTSNVGAAAAYGIRPVGTMAHSFVTAFESEGEAFREYAKAFPDDCTLLVDTYDTVEGVRLAIEVAGEMRRRGQRLRAVRLDSGDLADLARRSRAMLDEAGLPESRGVRLRWVGRVRDCNSAAVGRSAHRRVRSWHEGGRVGRRAVDGLRVQDGRVRRPPGDEAQQRQGVGARVRSRCTDSRGTRG